MVDRGSDISRSPLELRDQGRQGCRLFVRGEVTAGQPLDLEAEVAQPFLRKIDLPVLKGIFIAAAHLERELTAISLEEAAEVEPIALRFVFGHEACSSREVKQAIVAAHGVVELANLSVRDLIAFGPHNPGHHLEQGEGTAQTPAGPVGEAAQNWRGEPRVRVPVREESPIEDENAAYVRPDRGFAPLSALKPAPQVL